MSEKWTKEDEATFRPLKRKYDRIHKKSNRDKKRVRTYKPRLASNGKNSSKGEK